MVLIPTTILIHFAMLRTPSAASHSPFLLSIPSHTLVIRSQSSTVLVLVQTRTSQLNTRQTVTLLLYQGWLRIWLRIGQRRVIISDARRNAVSLSEWVYDDSPQGVSIALSRLKSSEFMSFKRVICQIFPMLPPLTPRHDGTQNSE